MQYVYIILDNMICIFHNIFWMIMVRILGPALKLPFWWGKKRSSPKQEAITCRWGAAMEMRKFSGSMWIPSGKHTQNYGTSPFFMGKSTISMVICHSYVKLPEGILYLWEYSKWIGTKDFKHTVTPSFGVEQVLNQANGPWFHGYGPRSRIRGAASLGS